MTFDKIEYKKGTIKLVWYEQTGTAEHPIQARKTLECDDVPSPRFITALRGLNVEVCTILELPKAYKGGMEVRTVNLGYDSNGTYVMLSFIKELDNGTWPANTMNAFLYPSLEEKLNILFDEARQYIKQTRHQLELFSATG